MDFPNTEPPPADRQLRRAFWAAAGLALAVYAYVLVGHVAALAGGSDTSGYFNQARLLAAGSVHARTREIPGLHRLAGAPLLYMPLGFNRAWNGDGIVPTYPVGLSLFIVALEPLAGWRHAGDAAMVLHSLAGLAATFALCRVLGLGRRWAAVAAAILALSPLYLFMSLQAMSDVPSLAWTAAAVAAALKGRERASWAVAAGAALAVDVLLRPANLLAIAPIAVALGASPRRWILLAAGALPGAAFFFGHNLAAYGSLAATGYGDVSVLFAARYVPGTLRHYAAWLPVLFTPLAAFALGLPWISSESPRTRWLLGTWVLAFAGFYAAYNFTRETWWYLRYLLPAAPAVLAGALLVLRAIFRRAAAWADPGRSLAAFASMLVLVAVLLSIPNRILAPFRITAEEQRYRLVADWMQKNIPADAVCLAMQTTGAIFYHTDFTFVRWDALNRESARKVEAAVRAAGRPFYAVLFPYEIEQYGVLRDVVPGRWIGVGKVGDVAILRRDFGDAKP